MLPRGQAWQGCISLRVSIRLRALRGISALARLGYLLDRACTETVAPCDGERIIKGGSVPRLDLLLPRFSHLSKCHQLFCPVRRSRDNFSIAYNEQASPGYTCLCSGQNSAGISPCNRGHWTACHDLLSLELASRTGQRRCRMCRCMLQKFSIKIWWVRFVSVGLGGFSGGVFIFSNCYILVS